jgi:hypothetical protein
MNDIRKDSMEVIREIIRTGKWKVGEPKKRRKQSLFSRKIAVDDLSYRSYQTEEGTFRSNREATINDTSNKDSSIHKEESGMTTVTAGDLKLEEI